jgi:hypothetical protein
MSDMANRMVEIYRVPRRSPLASLAFWSVLSLVLVSVSAGFGVRYEFWDFRFGFRILRICFFGGIVTGVTGLVGSWICFPLRSDRRGFTLSLTAVLLSGLVVGVPLKWKIHAEEAPAVHDVTTDSANPPQFRVVDRYRQSEHNDLEYGGDRERGLQEKHYPELQTTVVARSLDSCMHRALEMGRRFDWKVHRANWEDGWIEATDTTFWFGFKDDVVIRLRKDDEKCQVDLRSVSRVGKGDAGTNARRIRRFLNQFHEKD